MSDNPCICGKPIQDTANLCHSCASRLGRNLHRIADRWAELEDALNWREVIRGERGKAKNGMIAVGTNINEQAVRARRLATNAVFFTAQVLREDYDDKGWTFNPPKAANPTQDHTPVLARWIASGGQLDHIVKRADRDSAEEIAGDIEKAEKATFRATNPSGIHWVSANLACDKHGTSELGERVPCEGGMWMLAGGANAPDLVCDVDPEHVIDFGTWTRLHWKQRLRGDLDHGGMLRLADRMRG